MKIKLVQKTPEETGYYLVRFGEQGGLHLVLFQKQLDNQFVILPDICPFKSLQDKKTLKCAAQTQKVLYSWCDNVWWSEEPIEIGR